MPGTTDVRFTSSSGFAHHQVISILMPLTPELNSCSRREEKTEEVSRSFTPNSRPCSQKRNHRHRFSAIPKMGKRRERIRIRVLKKKSGPVAKTAHLQTDLLMKSLKLLLGN